MWIQSDFLSISLLTPNAQRLNVLLEKKKKQKKNLSSSVVKGVVKHSGVIIFFCTPADFIFASYALIRG